MLWTYKNLPQLVYLYSLYTKIFVLFVRLPFGFKILGLFSVQVEKARKGPVFLCAYVDVVMSAMYYYTWRLARLD